MRNLPASERTRLDHLLEGLARAFKAEGRPGGATAAAALRAARSRAYRRMPASSDPGALLEQACAHPEALPLAASVLACRELIDWSNWGETTLAPEIAAGLHTAELVGPDGHLEAEGVRVGLLVSASGIDYPVSRHSGEETYLVISGVAEWTLEGAPYAPRTPGTLIHHPAWAPHGRRTLQEPFLGAWRWSGDLDLSIFSVDGGR